MSEPMDTAPLPDDEVQRLQAEVERLKAQVAAAPAVPPKRHRGRMAAAWALLIIAALLTPLAVVGFWGHQTLVDSQRYIETVSPLSESTVIQDAVGTQISNGIKANTDVQAQVEELLPDQAKPLAGPIAAGIESAADRAVRRVLASDRFDALWVQINKRAQAALVKALEGDSSGSVKVTDEGVVLDLEDVFLAVRQELVDQGIGLAARIPVPPQAERQIVLLEGSQFKQLQVIYSFTEPIAQLLILVVALMFAGAVLLATDRRKMLLRVGVALVLAGAVLAVGLAIARTAISDSSATSDYQAAVLVFYDTMVRYLETAVRAVVFGGAALAFIAWFASPTGSGASVRRAVTSVLGSAGGQVDSPAAAAAGAWTRRAKRPLQAAVITVAVLSLLFRRPLDVGTLTWSLVLGLLALAVIEFVSALGSGDAAEAETPEPAAVGAPPAADDHSG